MVIREKAEIMSLGNVNAKLLIEKAVQDYHRYEMRSCAGSPKPKHRYNRHRLTVRKIAAFGMHFYDNMSYAEIARELDIPPSLTKYNINEVRGYVKHFLRMNKIYTVADALQ